MTLSRIHQCDYILFLIKNSEFCMADNKQFNSELFDGLKALVESAFPKRCANCGRIYESEEQFLLETQEIHPTKTGLKQSEDDDGAKIVEVFRNCSCGSTLMDFFSSRRDFSKAGEKRREKFQQLLDYLCVNGLDREIARTELIRVMHGEKSEILSKISPPTKTNDEI